MRAISTPVKSGTSSRYGLIWNLEDSTSVNALISAGVSGAPLSPMTVKAIRAMTKDGTVVISIYLIWVKSGVFTMEDASTVVSERGDILSPK